MMATGIIGAVFIVTIVAMRHLPVFRRLHMGYFAIRHALFMPYMSIIDKYGGDGYTPINSF